MKTDWRISTVNGALLAAYFVPAWTAVALRIMVSPIHGIYDRPNVALTLFVSDHLPALAMNTVRFGWLMAIGKLTVVAFFALFVVLTTRATIRREGGCDEALGIALALGGAISFASMVMASRVGEIAAMRLHATELLAMVGGIVLMAIEQPTLSKASPTAFGYSASTPNS